MYLVTYADKRLPNLYILLMTTGIRVNYDRSPNENLFPKLNFSQVGMSLQENVIADYPNCVKL